MLYLLIALALLPFVLAMGALLINAPSLFDPPGFGLRLRTYLTTHVARTRPDHPFPELRTRRYAISPKELDDAVGRAVGRLGWTLMDADAARRRVVVSTPLWRFRDDLEFEIRSEAVGSALDVRSTSRVGRADFAANARHIVDLYAELERMGVETVD